MVKNILIIANKKAGKGRIVNDINVITKNLQDLGYKVDVEYTEPNKSIMGNNFDENYDKLMICGGDGTLNQVIQELCELDLHVAISYIPFGTMNDFSRSLGISKDKYDISKNIDNYQEKEVDIGKFNDRFFNYVASLGIFSKTSYNTSIKMKNRFGRLAYIISGIKELFNYDKYHLKIYCENDIIENDFIYGSISNSAYIGGFHIFKKEIIDLSDGKFEAIFVKKTKNIFETIKIALKVFVGNLNDKNICYFKTSNLKIESNQDIEWSIDGEYGGNTREVEISNLNKKVTYLIPKGGIKNG